MDEKSSNAAAIRERFKQRGGAPSSKQAVDIENEKVDTIIGRAKEREAMYSEEGQDRADEHKKDKVRHDQAKTQYRQTTLRILLKDLARLKKLESRFLSDNSVLTYEKVFVAGLETIEKMSDSDLREYIEKSKKE